MSPKDTYRFCYLMGGISVSPDAGEGEALRRAENEMKRVGISPRSLHFRLYKRSVDARRREAVKLVCTVMVASPAELSESVCRRAALKPLPPHKPFAASGTEPMRHPPLVVGMGPAGLFAALLLAEQGYAPILIDRGGTVSERVRAVNAFVSSAVLDPECNVQFGAGGAGTFSDGKLVTRIHDDYCHYVLETLCRFGAPEEILTRAKPHIGTDVLRTVVENILAEIERLGGRLLYRCRMEHIRELPDGELIAETTCGEIAGGALVLAIGHSARDTYAELIRGQYAIEPKPISVGFRAEHLQSEIDRAMYGDFAGHPALGHAEYALSDTKRERGVYTFCMCPGGEVVAAASEEGGVVVNGMSNYARDGKNANAAVLVSVDSRDYEPVEGNAALGAIAFQRSIERAAYAAGGGNYDAPMMTAGAFSEPGTELRLGRVQPSYRGGRVKEANFDEIYPQFVTEALRYALRSFGHKLAGYDAPDTVLTGVETRTSAPLRILRLPDRYTAIGHDRIYPCGEGAGYAGGITSAAVDGLRVAEAILQRFSPMGGVK